ncbi:uncharacterized protein LY89DRAFT_772965 [Mollisia scopiformis]|uniref:DUF6604 domain-containing protein n=1 Tax=Mollisia scopiformis TaxID=149040 RepID=A0A194XJ46_MOLSC|nr:uncharacterized protein LY89DRAFT_772965 [Mollisia scopiformis]KUJ20149.1 hypothetical protein LY89DRAFT_772965 [Mollisia scopiformis]
MALDPDFFATYKQYKSGTTKVTTWLASKAQELALVDALFPTTPQPNIKGRLKGKERASQKPNVKKHIVLLLVSFQWPSQLQAQQSLVAIIEQQGDNDKSTKASNQHHQYFIGVLHEALQLLKPLSRPSKGTNGAEVQSEDTAVDQVIADLQNRFAYLEVDEPTEWTSSALPSKPHSTCFRDHAQLEST